MNKRLGIGPGKCKAYEGNHDKTGDDAQPRNFIIEPAVKQVIKSGIHPGENFISQINREAKRQDDQYAPKEVIDDGFHFNALS